jgi:nucleotide-binding universal stress UspA family protein
VLIARRPVATQSILVCVDGSRHASAAVDFLASLPWLAGTSVTVLGVVERDNNLPTIVNQARETLTGAGAQATSAVVEPDQLDLTITPLLTIFEQMDSQMPDLVVLGTSGLTGFSKLWVGSVASAVARHASSSVLVVRDPHVGNDADER